MLSTVEVCRYLTQRKRPSVVFEPVLHSPQLSELREVWKRLQPTDSSFELLLVFYY